MNCWVCPNFDKVSYNPHMLTLAINSRGISIKVLSNAVYIPLYRLTKIFKGEVEADNGEMDQIAFHLNYPRTFFDQWPDTELEIPPAGCLARHKEIDYSFYPIMGVSIHIHKKYKNNEKIIHSIIVDSGGNIPGANAR